MAQGRLRSLPAVVLTLSVLFSKLGNLVPRLSTFISSPLLLFLPQLLSSSLLFSLPVSLTHSLTGSFSLSHLLRIDSSSQHQSVGGVTCVGDVSRTEDASSICYHSASFPPFCLPSLPLCSSSVSSQDCRLLCR